MSDSVPLAERAPSPGYQPIDLIDGERLIELLQEYRLGIKQVRVVDEPFFEPFRGSAHDAPGFDTDPGIDLRSRLLDRQPPPLHDRELTR